MRQCRDQIQRALMRIVVAVGMGCGSGAAIADGMTPLLQIKLPAELREVSGLAVTSRGTILAVADEQALVFEVDPTTAKVVARTAIGRPLLRGDFEGLERVAETLYLVDSDGVVTEASVRNNQFASYVSTKTGAGSACEVEGLSLDPASGLLYLLCKKPRNKAFPRANLRLYAYSIQAQGLVTAAHINLDTRAALRGLSLRRFAPSALVFSEDGQQILVVAAKQKALLVFDRSGALQRAQKLPKTSGHRQTEGAVVLPDGRLVLADEGGKGAAQLSLYPSIWR